MFLTAWNDVYMCMIFARFYAKIDYKFSHNNIV